MSYYRTLGLDREPFSNSPDPDLLYRSKTHLECLQHMEIAVRLRRGLNVVLGEVGTGKTTLCRELLRTLAEDPDLETYLLDDPYFPGVAEFLLGLARLFGLRVEGLAGDQGLLKAAIKDALSRRGGDGRRIVTLLVDEGQKITGECLELLRELLNFETNTHKLLQIVIFAQKEFDEMLVARPNLDDRINFRYELRPLDANHTSRLIRARLNLCAEGGQAPEIFTKAALRRIYRATGGYPRKIVRLCHLSMLLCVGLGRSRVTWGLVGRAWRESRGHDPRPTGRWSAVAVGCGLAAFLAVTGFGLRALFLASSDAGTVASAATAAPASGLPDVQLSAHTVAAGLVGGRALSSSHAGPLAHASRPDIRLAAAKPAPVSSAPVATPAPSPTPSPAAAVPTAAPVAPVLSPAPATVVLAAPAAAPTASASLSPAVTRTVVAPAVTPAAAGPAASPAVAAKVVTPMPPAPGAAAKAAVPGAAAKAPASGVPHIVILDAEAPEVITVAAETPSQPVPKSLGSAVTRYGWTVSQQAVWLYGLSTRQVMARLAKANPGLVFDRIRAGQSVSFPAIRSDAPPAGHWLVKLGEVRSLEKGFVFLAKNRALPLTLFVTFRPDSGLCYEVVATQLYDDAAEAKAALGALPPALAAKATLVAGYPKGTVFFSNLPALIARRTDGKPGAPASGPRQVASREAR